MGLWYDVRVKFIKNFGSYIYNNPAGQWIPVFLILVVGTGFYFQNLGTSYITLWDEVVHVNVVKNLSQTWWPPKLHLTDIGSDFQDWTNNYIWVHKPLLPLYLQALVYKFSPTLWAFRLPGVIFALMTGGCLFWLVKKHFDVISAWVVCSFFVFNPYVLELVKGRQFSGLHDLMFVFFGVLALNQLLKISNLGGSWLWFGLLAGLGYLSKGGLAFLFFIPLLAIVGHQPAKKTVSLNFLYAGLVTLITIFPEKVYLLIVYPAEYFFEQSLQFLHLFKYLEYWGRPWDYYLSVYLRDMLTPQMYLVGLAGVGFGLYAWTRDFKLKLLTLWVLAFLVPLSVGMTKISNFILAILPAIYILLSQFFLWQMRTKKYAEVSAWASLSLVVYGLVRLDVGRIKLHLFQDFAGVQRFALAGFSLLGLAVLYSGFKFISQKINLARTAKILLGLSGLLIVGTYLRAMQINNRKFLSFADYPVQANLSTVASNLSATLPHNAIVLTYFPTLPKSHLYFQYFASRDAMEIYNRQPLFLLLQQLPKNRPKFVLSEIPLSFETLALITPERLYFYQVK